MRRQASSLDLVTVRHPIPGRYSKYIKTISKIVRVNLVTGSIVRTPQLGNDFRTVMAFLNLLAKSLFIRGPILLDVVAAVSVYYKEQKDIIIDFRTPYPVELMALGHERLAILAKRIENKIRNTQMAFAANDRMAKYCTEIGVENVVVIPNYPWRNFLPTVEGSKWKILNTLPMEEKIVLFTGSVRLREIYGLDLLLAAWKYVEEASGSTLIILGNVPIRYISMKMDSFGIKKIRLPGRVPTNDVANWINASNVCVAPRTPGFPKSFYDDKDSTKISEYAALRKPIVAAGYAPSRQYHLVDQDPQDLAEGILHAIEGKTRLPQPHYWEENEPKIWGALIEYLKQTNIME